MRISIRGRLFLVSMLLVVVAVFTGGLYLSQSLRDSWLEQTEDRLASIAATVSETIHSTPLDWQINQLDPLINRLGKSAGTRITVVDHSGLVIADSDIPTTQVSAMENHGHRPEIQSAFQTGQMGVAKRYSNTLATNMMYLALPCDREGGRYVIRVALSLKSVDQSIDQLHRILFIAGLLAFITTLVVGALAAHLYSRTIRQTLKRARELVASSLGDAEAAHGHDEFRGLLGSMHRLSDELNHIMDQLAQERDRFEAVLDSLEDALLVLDCDLKVTHANPVALNLFAFKRGLKGRNILDLLRNPQLHDLVVSAQSGRAERLEFDYGGTPKKRLLVFVARIEKTSGAILVLQDVTNLRRLENMRKDFLANVSHELRTPVSIIQANAETLLDGALEDKKQASNFVSAIQQNAVRLARLISDLLDISRIESGGFEINQQRLNLSQIVKRAVDQLTCHKFMHQNRITIDIDKSLQVLADEKSMEQILLNLLDNAYKYSGEQAQIIVRAYKQADYIRLEVEDHGPGIAIHHADRVFERFFRVDKGRSREMGGTGLGLAIVKHLTEQMDGQVGLEHVDPHGCRFFVELKSVQVDVP